MLRELTDRQHAALATSEVYLLQFHVLGKATGLHLPLATARPRSHPYPTYESQLPLAWKLSQTGISADPTDLVATAPPLKKDTPRPDLVCRYCSNVRAYATVAGLWSHIFHKHAEIDCSDRLAELRRAASLWRQYWHEAVSDGGKSPQTLERLALAESDTFCWNDVVAWYSR